MSVKISILGGGNIGQALAKGLLNAKVTSASSITVSRRNVNLLSHLASRGIQTTSDNISAVRKGEILFIAVRPRQINGLLNEIKAELKNKILISLIPDMTIDSIEKIIETDVPVLRAMTNLSLSIGESITCISAKPGSEESLEKVREIFRQTGETLIVDESLIPAATVLSSCGIAFFLRIIRAITQGGIQIGFHPKEAQLIAAQTAKGAASILLSSGNHPEAEIDKVTTPRGITIAGLNEMEHNGLNSAIIKGILTSYKQIEE